MKRQSWFEVSQKGLAQLQGPRPKSNILRELCQNCFDEGITTCRVETEKNGRSVIIRVIDDAPEGFRDITHAYTLFDYTHKRSDVSKRGRYNLGEKLAISNCLEAYVRTTKGTVFFNADGTRELRRRRQDKTDAGTIVSLKVAMTKEELDEALRMARKFFPPKGVGYIVNGTRIPFREPFRVLGNAYLQTEEYDQNIGSMRRTWKFTDVHLHEPLPGEVSTLYEMGIPIQEVSDTWHLDVQQKCPMTMDRDSVLPGYLRELRTFVLDRTVEQLPDAEVGKEWVREATRTISIKAETLRAIADKRWGENRFVADPSDPRSIDEARAHGYTQVQGGELDKDEWESFRKSGMIRPSSHYFPTLIVDREDELPEKDWTWEMRVVARYARLIAQKTLNKEIEVRIIRNPRQPSGTYQANSGILTLNRGKLEPAWWASGISEEVTDLLLHELGHEGGAHTEHGYHKTLTKIAAKLVMLVKEQSWLIQDLTRLED